MGILKKTYKIHASSLVETIVATIIITIVFTLATVSVTGILKQSVTGNMHEIDTELQKLSYLYLNGRVKIPNTFDKGLWNIEVKKSTENTIQYIVFTAKNSTTNKVRVKKLLP